MAVKTITVTKEAYEALASDKRKDESFSEVILRTHNKKGSWEAVSKFIGAWEHIPDKVIEHGEQKELYAECEYDTNAIIKTAIDLVGVKKAIAS